MSTSLLRIFVLWAISFSCFAQQIRPSNDDFQNAIVLTNTTAFCTDDGFFTNENATPTAVETPNNWPATGRDVWFKFTATRRDVAITVTGISGANSINTLTNPLIAIYEFRSNGVNFDMLPPNNLEEGNNVTTLSRNVLIIGRSYLIRVSARNNAVGTFKLCLDNFTPPFVAGQDCSSASFLCTKEPFTQLNVRKGGGLNSTEVSGTCLPTENASVWYNFKAATSGTLTFTITPTVANNDIDWVFFDLGETGDCSNVKPENALRCAAGNGVSCDLFYNKTGMSLTETDETEGGGCGPDKNGFVKFVDLVAGRTYALVVDNFSEGNNGFSIEFGGTAEFEGPKAEIAVTQLNNCTDNQAFIFENKSANFKEAIWNFGDGADMSTSNEEGPIHITYNTEGTKTVTLEVKSATGCIVVATHTFLVAKTPAKPAITASKTDLCKGDILVLSTPSVKDGVFKWSGPNNFTSDLQNPEIPATGEEILGTYTLTVTVGTCISEENSIIINSINELPIPNFDIIVRNKCEENQAFEIINNSKKYTSIKWDFGNGVKTATMPNEGNGLVTYATPGKKNITVTVSTPNGCEISLTQVINVSVKAPKPEISANKTSYCLGDEIVLSVPKIDGDRYRWTGPDNFIDTTATVKIPVTNLFKSGTYELNILTDDCISETGKISIPFIAKVPVTRFVTDPNFNYKFSAPVTIKFKNESLYADRYLWDFGDGTTSTAESPTHTFSVEGNYVIKLTAISDNGCAVTLSSSNLLLTRYAMLIPNAFSPNGDGINDEFSVNIVNLKQYNLQIFDRNGAVVFSTKNIFENWDGRHQGKESPIGVYYYTISGIDLNNKPVKYTNNLTIIR